MNIITRNRNSEMANRSKSKIERLIEENYTKNKASFSRKVISKVIEESRYVLTPDYDNNGLLWMQDYEFTKNAFPGYSKATEKTIGLSDP